MGPIEAVQTVMVKYFTFRGRAPRSEYWWFMLFYSALVLAAGAADGQKLYTALSAETLSFDTRVAAYWTPWVMLGLFVPYHTVSVRRLHDIGLSGFWMLALIYGLKLNARALLPGPLYLSAPDSFGLRAGRLGGALVLMPRFDPEAFLKLVQDYRIDTIFMVPTMFVRLMKLPEEVRKSYDVSSLRHVIHAAAPCPADVKRAMIDWWGPVIHEFYGSTESGAVTFATPEDALRKPGTVGRIAPGAELRFIGDDGRQLPPGEIGEIYSRIASNPDFTYHNKSGKRAEIDRGGFITSGDVGYIDADGYVFICDRKRDMVISGGVNIYPAEIEAALLAIPGVHDCAVFGIPDAEFGEALMGIVEPQPGVTLDVASIRADLGKVLAGYKVPRHIEIGGNLPREDSGKIFKRKLRDPYWHQAGRRI